MSKKFYFSFLRKAEKRGKSARFLAKKRTEISHSVLMNVSFEQKYGNFSLKNRAKTAKVSCNFMQALQAFPLRTLRTPRRLHRRDGR